jgi:mRNA interferase MazF
MARTRYIPDRGDFVWLDLDPQTGHEQAGHRPALVLSPRAFNGMSGLCVICPATTKPKGYPFEVPNPAAPNPKTVVLSEHVRCVDWRARKVQYIDRVPDEVLLKVVDRVEALIIRPGG